MRRIRVFWLVFLFCVFSLALGAGDWSCRSVDSRLELVVESEPSMEFSLLFDGVAVLRVDDLDLYTQNDVPEKVNWVRRGNRVRRERIVSVVPRRNSQIDSEFREVIMEGDHGLSLVFRLYNRALAFRLEIRKTGEMEIRHEKLDFILPGEATIYFPEEKSLQSHYESLYQVLPLSSLREGQTAQLPLLMRNDRGISMLFNEADVHDYPCLFLRRTANGLGSRFPGVVTEAVPRERGPDRNERITEDSHCIARVTGSRALPWRIVTVTDDERDLLGRDLVFELSSPGEAADWSWVKPGKVAWDWWNACNLFGVPFKAGLNTETYKEYIDFAADFGIEYVILDEGWSRTTTDVLHFKPEMRVDELIAYGRQRGVGVILWLLWKPLDQDMENILDTYRSWGVKGVKVDFMQRADQYMVNFYARVAREAAKRQLLVDFHGAFKPTGLHRAYPNVLSYEGVMGLEQSKWSDAITPDHDLLLPFIRMSAGPMDYTPGAMDNAGQKEFFPRFNRPMSQGTRVHQMALYVVYESPLQMLCDSPSRYRREESCARFLARIPTTWDETRVLEARVGDYLALARRKGQEWYLAALTDWTAREILLDLSFLPAGKFRLEYVEDGVNADRMATDHCFKTMDVTRGLPMVLQMAPGGGWLGVIRPVE